MIRELSLQCYGVGVGVVDDTDADVGARLSALLPPECVAQNGGTPDVRYEVRARVPGDSRPRGGYEVVRDGELAFQAPEAPAIIRWLQSDIDARVAGGSRRGLFVHAGVVSWRGHGIVIPGRSLTGKSTLVASLLRRGARYYSDEFAVIDDEGRVHPYARPLSLRDRGGRGRPVTIDELGGVAGADPVPVSLIVSTAYQEGAPWRPDVLTGARAVLPLIDSTVRAREEPGRTLRLAGTLARTVRTLRGARPDAEAVASKILDFLDDALDGGTIDPARARYATASRRLGRAYHPPVDAPSARGDDVARERDWVCPATHLRLNHFLGPAEHRRILGHVAACEADFAPSRLLGLDGTVRVDPDVRRSRSVGVLDGVWELFESRLLSMLPHVRRELGIAWFPIGRIQRQLNVHEDGAFFGVHTDDGVCAVAGRRLTCVYNLHTTPKRFSGGELRLYDGVIRNGRVEPAPTYTDLDPLDNSLVFFPSGVFHEVRPVQCETAEFRHGRFTITVWFWAGARPTWRAEALSD
jgi:hypothetical protein